MLSCLGIIGEIVTQPATESGIVDFSILFVKMLLMLAVVIVLAILFLKYVVPRLNVSSRMWKDSEIAIKYRKNVSPRSSLLVVDVSKRRFLLGVTEHSVNHIAELQIDEKEIEKGDL